MDLYALGKDDAGDDDLFAFKGKLTESFLDNHQTLVVNTALYEDSFKWRRPEVSTTSTRCSMACW